MPQRSVTRFFIPLIDVLTLLFCIYLLMPMVSRQSESLTEKERQLEDRLRYAESELSRRDREGLAVTDQMRKDIEDLRKAKVKALQERLAVRVLEIDGETGNLYYRDPERMEVKSEGDARELIDRDRRERGVGQKELYYLILYPRDPRSAYPTQEQRRRYDRWFAGVALGYDIPGAETRP
jgi:hypothetical protein